MKQLTILLISAFSVIQCYPQNNQDYVMFMTKQISAMAMVQTIDGLQDQADTFERIADSQTDKWHPLYYAAFCYVNMSFKAQSGEEKDIFLDKAQSLLDRALEIYPDESELMVLQGLLYQGRIQVDPKSRGRSYSGKANKSLKKAKEFNPDNPRAYYLLGLNVLHTPEALGGGSKAACPLFTTAHEKFKSEVPNHVLNPGWGAEENYKQFNLNCPDTN